MKNFLIAFTVFFIWFVLSIWIYSCKVKNLCYNTNETQTNNPTVKETENNSPDIDFIKIDSISTIPENKINNLIIYAQADSITLPSSIDSINNSFFEYLNTNQSKEILITGLYNTVEKEDLGLKRAEKFKSNLISFGINSDKIMTQSMLHDFSFSNSDAYSGGILYEYQEISEERSIEIEKGITNKILYASFASKNFNPDNTLKAYALEIKTYLEKYPDKNVLVTGHTDNIGKEEDNHWIGKQRADNVKKYLISQGISTSRITSSSEGENSPVADNTTESGRKKNRRIEININ